jgi:hypothetical protein
MAFTTAAMAVLSTAAAVKGNMDQAKAAGQAQDRAKAAVLDQDRAMNKANQKKADPTAALAAAMAANKGGNASTFLTGPAGVPLNTNSSLGA